VLLTVLCDPSAPGLAGSGRLHGKREALTGELAVTRDRLDTLERVAASKGLFSAEDIEAYELDAEAMEARAARHQGIFREVTRTIVTELEDLQDSSEQEYTRVVDFVENDG